MATKPVVLEGSMKKLKTMKKKYFVLFPDSVTEKANLRYYDNEKKYKQAMNKREPVNTKRCIILRDCFNINRKMDTRYQNVLAMYTKDECFAIVFDEETELLKWLGTMLRLHRDSGDDPPKPTYEHIWEATVQKKGLGETRNLWGPYRVCINERALYLIRVGINNWTGNPDDPQYEIIDISLASIRRYGASNCIFYLEVGRVSKTGAGEFWMETTDPLIAQNMHDTILRISSQNKQKHDEWVPSGNHRGRSQSVNESSKSHFLNKNSFNTRLDQTTNTDTPNKLSTSKQSSTEQTFTEYAAESVSSRERCDSLPSYNAAKVINAYHNAKANLMNRPNSLCTHSPTNSSPLSPVSLSRSDDDSSFSVDEVDGPHLLPHQAPNSSSSMNDVNRATVMKNMTTSHSKMTIYEENSEDFSVSDKEISESLDRSLKISETNNETGYVLMLGTSDTAKRNETRSRTSSFVDDHTQRGTENLSSSASSITSGTPSTDTRFSAYHLDKVPALLFREDAEEEETRPARTYSVGSKPEFSKTHRGGSGSSTVTAVDKGPLENIKNSRTRAFSLGSKARHYPTATLSDREEIAKKIRKMANEKSTSVPSLSKGSLEVVNDDLMELDFTNNSRNTPTRSYASNSSKMTHPIQSPRSPDDSPYMEMIAHNSTSKNNSVTTTRQLEMEKNAKNSLTMSSSVETNYVDMEKSSFDGVRSLPIAITAKKTTHCGAADEFTTQQQPKESVEHSQNMIFSLSLENIKTDEALKLMEQNENGCTTPPTEPLVSPIVCATTEPEIFHQQQQQPVPPLPPPQPPCDGGEYTMIRPPTYQCSQHNYVELDFPPDSNPAFRKEVKTTKKPLYAQLMFPVSATTATAPTTTTICSNKNKKNIKK